MFEINVMSSLLDLPLYVFIFFLMLILMILITYKGNIISLKKFIPNYKVSSLKAKIFKKPGVGTNSWLPLASKLSVFEQKNN